MARSVLISGENLQTIVSVTFVLTLLAVAFNFYNFTRVQQAHGLATRAANDNLGRIQLHLDEQASRVDGVLQRLDAVEARLDALQAQAAAPSPAPDGR